MMTRTMSEALQQRQQDNDNNGKTQINLKENLQPFFIHLISTCSIGYELNTVC